MDTGIVTDVDMTCCTVHKTIQQMATTLEQYRNEISLTTLANAFNVNIDQMAAHINTLHTLRYIDFTDRIHENICLTIAGRYTVVPEV